MGRVNANAYNHVVEDWFTQEQVVLMYRSNPLWASIELRLYGDLCASTRTPDVAQVAHELEPPVLQGCRVEGFEVHESGVWGDVFGWVVPREGSVSLVRIYGEDRVIAETPLNRPRPDVAAAFPSTPLAVNAGFRVGVELASLPPDGTVHVEAVLSDGVHAPLGSVHIRSASEVDSHMPATPAGEKPDGSPPH
jgi:hypothetical protein